MTKNLRHKSIYQSTKKILDKWIDTYIEAKSRFPSKRIIEPLVKTINFGKYRGHLGRGWYKNVYYLMSRNRKRHLVLKTGKAKDIVRDSRIFKSKSPTYFSKVYWSTKYCILQKYAKPVKTIPKNNLEDIRAKAQEFGLIDVEGRNTKGYYKNIGKDPSDGKYKIFDASLGKSK